MKIKKLIIFFIVFELGILPSFSKITGKISKSHFYDAEKTIMTDIVTDNTLKTGKYWGNNLLYFNKYRPIFMLSNKELYDLMPRENVSVMQRIIAPSIYNISLKTSSIKSISLSPPTNVKKQTITQAIVAKTQAKESLNKPDKVLISLYEQAKSPEIQPEKKLEAALLLKDSKISSNYNLAIDLLDDITKKEPYNAYAFYIKGELYSEKKDFENAMKNYVEALKLNPTSKQCCLSIAKILEPTNKNLAQKYYEMAR